MSSNSISKWIRHREPQYTARPCRFQSQCSKIDIPNCFILYLCALIASLASLANLSLYLSPPSCLSPILHGLWIAMYSMWSAVVAKARYMGKNTINKDSLLLGNRSISKKSYISEYRSK